MLCPAGMALELASPLLPGAFLLLACLGSIARAVTGVAGGATRIALTQHFARRRNAADIAAKEGSQVHGPPRVQPPLATCCLLMAHAGAQTGTRWDPSLRARLGGPEFACAAAAPPPWQARPAGARARSFSAVEFRAAFQAPPGC